MNFLEVMLFLIPWWISRSNNCDHMGRWRRNQMCLAGSVGLQGLQPALLLTGHRDLQTPPHGERGEVQLKQLSTASQAPDKFHIGFNRSDISPKSPKEGLYFQTGRSYFTQVAN